MSFPLKELSRLLTQESALLGVVVGLVGDRVRVATAKGAVTALTLEGVAKMAVGERVLIRQGVATKAPAATAVFPV